ncbi:MAG: hypothetical protein P1S60_06150 [Anaerolineae bacterium]|nr:hypothetical protein [Anaerolineae bacterium]
MDTIRRVAPQVWQVVLGYVRKTGAFWGLVILLLWCLSPPGVLVSIPEIETVRTLNSKVGVHTRLTDEVEPWKIQRTLISVREMGAAWIVEYFPWAYIEPVRDEYTWTHSDLVIAHARSQGLRIIARLGMIPTWAQPDTNGGETTFTDLDAAHYSDFANFTAAFIDRYRDDVQHVIIWNEPNLSFEWGYRTVDPVGYTALLESVYSLAHRVNPEIIILGGALAPTLEAAGSPAGLNDLVYLQQMYDAGAASFFDALAAHAYGLAFPPDLPPAEEEINFRRVELLRDIMVRNGDGHKQIYVTEAGWNDHPRWLWSVPPGDRIRYTLDAYRWAEENWNWCPVVAMWMFRTPVLLHNYQDHYAFVGTDFQPRLIYNAVREYTGNQP